MGGRQVNIPHKLAGFSKIKKKYIQMQNTFLLPLTKYRTSYKVKTARCHFINTL